MQDFPTTQIITSTEKLIEDKVMNNELFAPLNKSESDAIKGGFAGGYLAQYLPTGSPQASSAVNVNGSFNQDNDVLNNVAVNNGNFVPGSFNFFSFSV